MLWHKGWLETRIKLAMALGLVGFFLALYAPDMSTTAKFRAAGLFDFGSITVVWTAALLAGAGIATQPVFQATKGLHGSTLYTLSMPVSRLRLLMTRVTIGWLESVAVIAVFCGGLWLIAAPLRAIATPANMFEHAGTLIAWASTIYFLSVFLATFVDEQMRITCTVLAAFACLWISSHYKLPASVDIVHAMSDGSPLLTHTMPWALMTFSFGLAAILFFAALKITQTREY
jgi:hypothetical protein